MTEPSSFEFRPYDSDVQSAEHLNPKFGWWVPFKQIINSAYSNLELNDDRLVGSEPNETVSVF